MNDNNVYVRSSKTIRTISLARILLLIPLILYGYYKNGIIVYNNLNDSSYLIKPLVLLFGSALIGALVNVLYEIVISKNKRNIFDMIFSSFHVEYGVILACITSINVNLLIYFSVLSIIFIISKFIKNRVNIIALIFIIIYVLMSFNGGFSFLNSYEVNTDFSFSFLDYLLGRASGGLFATNVIFLVIAYVVLSLTNNTKSSITLSAIIWYIILFLIYYVINKCDVYDMLFLNNYLFIFTYVITDSVTSCYTNKGTILYGSFVGIFTFGLYFFNPVLAPFIAVLVISLFNNLIDRKLSNFDNRDSN